MQTRTMAIAGGIVALAALVVVPVGVAKTTKHSAAFTACLVTDIGGLNDRGFNHLAYVGLQRAKTSSGLVPPPCSSPRAGTITSRTSRRACVEKYKANLVIGVGFLTGSSRSRPWRRSTPTRSGQVST